MGRRVAGGLEPGVVPGFFHRKDGQAQAQRDVGGAEQERPGAQSVVGGDVAGGQRGPGDAEVAGSFVQAHGQTAPGRADEVHLHDHGGGPRQALADAEDHVGGDDPAPGGSEDQQQRHGDGDQPAGNQHGFAAVAVREGAREVVGAGLGEAEGQYVGQGRRIEVQVEDLSRQQRQDGAFLPEGASNKRVDGDQEHELGDVLPEAQSNGGPGAGFPGGGVVAAHLAAAMPVPVSTSWPAADAQSAGPPLKTAMPVRPDAARMLAPPMARSP